MSTKVCNTCHDAKPLSVFGIYRASKDGRRGICKECRRRKQRNYYAENRDAIREKWNTWYAESRTPERVLKKRERKRKAYRKLYYTVVNHYGAVCACCGETEPLFLTIDHINDDGADHRKAVAGSNKGAGDQLYRDIIKQGFPDWIQILCMNCNMGKRRNHGICPHGA